MPYGRLDEILSFYPEEMEKLAALKEEIITGTDSGTGWKSMTSIPPERDF